MKYLCYYKYIKIFIKKKKPADSRPLLSRAKMKNNFPFFFSFSQFFTDVKEAEEKLKKMQDTMKRKYTCDRSITVTRLEDLLQDAAVRRLSRSSEHFSLWKPASLLLVFE